ncbi:MAG: hypothetical protein QF530_08575 [SAR202 cluster bacterium]|nr:hypothetical protein [SAR202 cluster bacterium]
MRDEFELRGTSGICGELERIASLCIEHYRGRSGIALTGFSTVVTLLPPDSKRSRHSVLGHFTLNKTWMARDGETFREIAVNPYLIGSMSPPDIVETIYHETIHLYCLAAGVKDCASNGRHNRRFATAADLSEVIEAYRTDDWLGYSTRLTERGRKWVDGHVRPREHELTKILPERRKSAPKRTTLICEVCRIRVMVPSGKWRNGKAFLGCFLCMKALKEDR